MVPVELLVKVAGAFERARVRFVVFGGMAMAAWIRPRATEDCDIVVLARRRNAPRLKRALFESGARVTALEMRWIFERPFVRFETTLGPMLDVHLASSRHDRAAVAQARPMKYGGHEVSVVRPEDLILYKLKAWRPQDQVDILAILEQVKPLDLRYLESWLDAVADDTSFPIRERWNAIRRPPAAEAPPLLKRIARRRAAAR